MKQFNRVSHSQADAYNSCEKKFEYAHVDNLQPKSKSHQLARGIYGHRVLEVFFNNIKEGRSQQDSAALALREAISLDPVMYGEVGNRIFHFINVKFPTLGWEILEVEKTFFLPLGEGREYPFTVDLIIRNGGRIWIVDHKFSADAYDDDLMEVYPQLPRYIGALRILKNMGKFEYDIYNGMYNFIRTRPNMKDLDAMLITKPLRDLTNARIKMSLTSLIDTTERINNHEGKFLRTFNNNCKFCDFLDLCRVEMAGEDSTAMKNVMYEPNEYGYEELEKV